MMRDLFERFYENKGPLGKWAKYAEGYFVFPKLEGQSITECFLKEKKLLLGVSMITWD